MILNYSKSFFLFLICILVGIVSQASGGSWGSGGGNAVVIKGKLRFVDTLSAKELQELKESIKANPGEYSLKANQELTKLWQQNRYVKKSAFVDKDFFKSTNTLLTTNESEYPVLKLLRKQLSTINVLQMEIRLEYKTGGDGIKSSTLPANIQEPLAYYDRNNLFVSKRAMDALSPSDREEAKFHEAFRHLNFIETSGTFFSTEEIEMLVRHFSKKDRAEEREKIKVLLTKLKNVEVVANLGELKKKAATELNLIMKLERSKIQIEDQSCRTEKCSISNKRQISELDSRINVLKESQNRLMDKIADLEHAKNHPNLNLTFKLMTLETDDCYAVDVLKNKIRDICNSKKAGDSEEQNVTQ